MAENEIKITVSNNRNSLNVGVGNANNQIGVTGDNSQYFSNEARKSAEQAKASAEEARQNAQGVLDIKQEILEDESFLAVKNNMPDIITTAANIEDINIAAENIEDIKDASLLANEFVEIWEAGVADNNLSNLTEAGQAKFNEKANVVDVLNKSQITNCLLEVPQRIKLELADGVLTLKAGSEVIVPNGFEADGTTHKFDYRTINADKTRTGGTANKKIFVMLNSGLDIIMRPVDYAVSGQTVTASDNTTWYDTANNVVKAYYGASPISSGCTLPLAIASCDSSGAITSIDQIFNGIGYIGSTVWVDKGVRGLIPNSRNEDGSLKNIEFVTDTLLTEQLHDTANVDIFINIVNGKPALFTWTDNLMFHVDKLPTNPINAARYYVIPENKWYFWNNGWYSAITEAVCHIGEGIIKDNRYENIDIKQPFRAIDYSDKSTIASWAMPSAGNHIPLTLGASNTQYTAPANGYVSFAKLATAANQFIYMNASVQVQIWSSAANQWLQAYLPVAKGKTFIVGYTADGETALFNFRPVQGEVL